MPIYEYYCKPCNTIFNFYATTFSIDRQPSCPRCSGELHKQISAFSLGSRLKGPGSLPLSSQRLQEGMQRLDDFGRQNPQEAARLRKKFSEMTDASFEEAGKRTSSAAPAPEDPGGPIKAAGNAPIDERGILPERDPHLYEL